MISYDLTPAPETCVPRSAAPAERGRGEREVSFCTAQERGDLRAIEQRLRAPLQRAVVPPPGDARPVVVRGLLVSAKPQTIRLRDIEVHFEAGDTIHTGNSFKYDLEEFNRLAVHAGWCRVKYRTDEKQYFSVQSFEQARRTGNRAEHNSSPRSVTFGYPSSTQEDMQ